MARIEDIERRLLNWARWKLGETSGGLGYAAMRWTASPAGGGVRESIIPTNDCEAEETDRAVLVLESRLRATVEVVYLQGCSMRQKAQQLCCGEQAVKVRVWQAHAKLSKWLADKAETSRVERMRLSGLRSASVSCHRAAA
jgi:hypothetical protein